MRSRTQWIGAPVLGAALLLGAGALCAAGGQEAVPGADVAQVGPRTEPVDLTRYAQVRYVSASGSDARGDGSRGKPWASPAHALEKIAGAGPQGRAAVCIGEGTYTVASLRLKPHVDLFGGFSAGWERDVARYLTTLDAKGKDRVLIGANDARVDGFTLRGGRKAAHGGAVLCDRTSPSLTNNRFEDNATLVSPAYLHGIYHQVGTEGGAVACINYASPRIERNLFLGNSTGIGGGGAIGMRCDSVRPAAEIPPPVVRGNVFLANRTGTADTDPDVKKRLRTSNGGAVALSNYLADISNNLFIGNHAGGNGDAGGIYCEYESSPRIAHNHFLANRAEDDGAAIYSMKLSEPVIEANVFSGNAGGGSVRVSKQGRARILGNLIYANPAGGVYTLDSWALVEKNVIMDNAGSGYGHQFQTAMYMRPPQVRGNVIRGNKGGDIRAEGPEPAVVERNNIQGGYSGAGNVDVDPRRDTATLPLAVTSARYDERAGITTAETVDAIPPAGRLRGRVVRSDQGVGVALRSEGKRVLIWGKMPSGAGRWDVLGSYLPLAP